MYHGLIEFCFRCKISSRRLCPTPSHWHYCFLWTGGYWMEKHCTTCVWSSVLYNSVLLYPKNECNLFLPISPSARLCIRQLCFLLRHRCFETNTDQKRSDGSGQNHLIIDINKNYTFHIRTTKCVRVCACVRERVSQWTAAEFRG